MKNILFVCSLNWHRSKTAENIFSKYDKFYVRSAGIKKFAETILTNDLVEWADIIFVMDKKHHQFINTRFSDSIKKQQIITLNIEDKYTYMDPELVTVLEKKVNPYLI